MPETTKGGSGGGVPEPGASVTYRVTVSYPSFNDGEIPIGFVVKPVDKVAVDAFGEAFAISLYAPIIRNTAAYQQSMSIYSASATAVVIDAVIYILDPGIPPSLALDVCPIYASMLEAAEIV